MSGFENKTILITGASGLIGSNLVDRLMQSGIAKLIVTGRNKSKLEKSFPDYNGSKIFQVIEHDASTPYPEEIKNVDYIFHAAGPMERNIVMNNPVNVILPNVLGTINALEFLKKQESETGCKGRAVIFSSVTVYNNPTNEDYVAVERETSFAQPLDALSVCYSESKRMSEVIAKSYVKQYGIDAVIARFSTVYGPTRNIPDTAFYEFISNAVEGRNIVLNGVNAPRRDNIYVDDAVEGLMQVALKGIRSESYNISSNGERGNYIAVDEIAELIAKVVGNVYQRIPVKVVKPLPAGQRKPGLKLSNEKLKKLGWSVTVCQEEGVRFTVEQLYNLR